MKKKEIIELVSDGKKKNYKFINKIHKKDLKIFLKKFLGVFIYRGKKSRAMKLIDFFYFSLKLNFKFNPLKIMYRVIKNLMPFLVTGLKTYKGRIYYVPIIVKGNKKNVLVID